MKKNKPEQQQARVLGGFTLDGVVYESNDIIEAHTQIIKSLGTAVDTGPEAVEQCLKAAGSAIKRHQWTEQPVYEAQATTEQPAAKNQ